MVVFIDESGIHKQVGHSTTAVVYIEIHKHGQVEGQIVNKVATFKNPTHPDRMIELVFQHLITEAGIKRIFLDGKKPRWYERRLKKVLRDKGLSIRKLKTVRKEESHHGLQLADSLAGLLRYHYDYPESKDAKHWVRKLKRERKLFAQFIFEGGS